MNGFTIVWGIIKMDESESFSQYMDTKRLETLVDGIFAIAMTLLVLGLAVPVIRPPLTNAGVETAIISIISQLYIVSCEFCFTCSLLENSSSIFQTD